MAVASTLIGNYFLDIAIWPAGNIDRTMTSSATSADSPDIVVPRWGAVFAIALSISGLITAEQLPASLLSPMAEGLDITPGLAGQTVSVTAFLAILSSLFVTTLTRGIDRRHVVMWCVALMTVSSLLVALGPGIGVVLVGRALLGVAVGGLWAMAASLAMRLVPAADVPKALSIIFGGVSIALVIAAPLGSFLGAVIGWRGVFVLAAGFSLVSLVWLAISIPSLPARRRGQVGAAFKLLSRAGVALAMVSMFAVFAGRFTFFTYMRPFFEEVSGFDVTVLSAAFLTIGIANFCGTALSSVILRQSLKGTLMAAPLVLALCLTVLLMAGSYPAVVFCTLAIWGLATGLVPVAWSTWVTRNLGDDAENAGGLQVAVIQFAAMTGAGLGGAAFNAGGADGSAMTGALLLFISVALIGFGISKRT